MATIRESRGFARCFFLCLGLSLQISCSGQRLHTTELQTRAAAAKDSGSKELVPPIGLLGTCVFLGNIQIVQRPHYRSGQRFYRKRATDTYLGLINFGLVIEGFRGGRLIIGDGL